MGSSPGQTRNIPQQPSLSILRAEQARSFMSGSISQCPGPSSGASCLPPKSSQQSMEEVFFPLHALGHHAAEFTDTGAVGCDPCGDSSTDPLATLLCSFTKVWWCRVLILSHRVPGLSTAFPTCAPFLHGSKQTQGFPTLLHSAHP